MKLISLSCNNSNFKTVNFNPSGLTLIVGDGSRDLKNESTSNGTGKTLAMGLVNFCLGGKLTAKHHAAVMNVASDWVFKLLFSIENIEYLVERGIDDKEIWLNQEKISLSKLRTFLNERGLFKQDERLKSLVSFRSLISRFMRYEPQSCVDVIRTTSDPEMRGGNLNFEVILRTLFLLGLDYELVLSKRDNKNSIDSFKTQEKLFKNDGFLKQVFNSGTQPKVRLSFLEDKIPKLQLNLKAMKVAEDYREIENQANSYTKQIRVVDQEINAVDFKLSRILDALQQQPDISKQELLAFYQGLEAVFKPEALAHFSAVEAFHSSLAESRALRLNNERQQLLSEQSSNRKKLVEIQETRSRLIESLKGKNAFDEQIAVQNELSSLEAEKAQLEHFININSEIVVKKQLVKEAMVQEDRRAQNYVLTEPLREANHFFSSLTSQIFPNNAAGITLDSNTGDNQVRYKLVVQIEGDGSDGINQACILCFDWLIFMMGKNHKMRFVWHDNRLFAHINEQQRANWFKLVSKSLINTQKQYVATINTENLNAMKSFLSEEEWLCLEQSTVLTLKGDAPQNRLFGLKFGAQI